MEDATTTPEAQAIQPGSPEYDQAMIDKFDEQSSPAKDEAPAGEEAPKAERPEWLPEKFATPEDFAKAYAELERKQSQGQKPDATQQEDQSQKDEIKAAVDSAGLDFDDLSAQFAASGDISKESREALVKAGYPEHMIETHLAGLRAIQQLNTMVVHNEAGGEEAYKAITTWAAQTLSAEEIDAFNDTLDSGDMGRVKLAVAGLKAKYEAVNGAEPNLFSGDTGAQTGDVFRSTAELTAAMRDPRYQNDPAYRSDIERRLAKSNIF